MIVPLFFSICIKNMAYSKSNQFKGNEGESVTSLVLEMTKIPAD